MLLLLSQLSLFMATSLWTSQTLTLLLFLLQLCLPLALSVHFSITRFEDGDDPRVVYQGDAVPTLGSVELSKNYHYLCQVGRVISAERLHLWDAHTRQLTDFTTRFSFTIDMLNRTLYAAGLAFFLAPVGFEIPPNSAGGFLGLFNTTSTVGGSFPNHVFHVEFDTFVNTDWDPGFEHVGINNNSISSAVYTLWNASFHSGDIADALINYNASTMNLSVSWSYRRTQIAKEETSLSFRIDLRAILPEWVIFGFSAATSNLAERHVLHSWEFSSTLEADENKGDDTKKERLLVGLIVSAAGVVIIGMIIAFLVLVWKRKQKNRREAEAANLTSMNADLERGAGPRRFSYKDLELATNSFSARRKLGQGGFGEVYKGYFNDLDLIVAVKKISSGSKQGKKEYVTEVKVISSLRHRNLVQLMGWCHEKGEFLLVYEYMPNGSLDYHLFGTNSPLTWAARYKIALGLSSALLYLHEECEQCVVHRDIKSSNVMLDSNFNAKLGDFGLARLMDHGMGPKTTGLVGTLGYLAPEYVSTGRPSKESDIYSFGVVAIEIATGKKSIAPPDGNSEMGLVEWVWDLYGKGMLLSAVDERLQTDFEEKQVEYLMIVGLWCAHPDRSFRPSIKQAIQVLNFESTLPILPTSMPVPVYHAPMFPTRTDELFTTSLEA